MSNILKLGVIGIGHMGTKHIRNILAGKCPEIEVKAVCDVKSEPLEWCRENVPGVEVYNSFTELIDSGSCDAVLISVPHYFHCEIAAYAFSKGLHVMTEKPVGVYTLEVEKLIETAEKSGKIFGVMFNQRTNCVYRKLREIVKSGEMGEIRRTNWIITDWFRTQKYYDSGDWRATWKGEGGGVLLNQCPHNLDLWQWICGMPKSVTAFTHNGKWHNIEVEDDVTAYVEYPNGATGVFVASTGDAPGTNRLEIDLDKGKLVVEDMKLYRWLNTETIEEFELSNTKVHGKPEFVFEEVETDGLNLQHSGVLNAFASAILHGSKLIAEGNEGINALTLSNAMHLSSWTGMKVELPLDAGLFYNELQKKVNSSTRLSKDHYTFDSSKYDI